MNEHHSRARARGRPLDVAIVGMACRFPGARDLVEFWGNVVAGRPSRQTGGDPGQFFFDDAARAALVDAGIGEAGAENHRVEVVIGRSGQGIDRSALIRLQHERALDQTLGVLTALNPEWTEAERAAVRDDLKASLPPIEEGSSAGWLGRLGARYVVDAEGATPLAAIELAARGLVTRRADLAIAGVVSLESGRGAGVGAVVLKRLADAERDGDRVYAVLKGIGLAGAKGRARATRRACRLAGIDPETVNLRTPVAGMAGLIATALALHHRLIPPTPDTALPSRPWTHGDDSHPRRAGVNAFGLAGMNAHAVLEEHAPSADGATAGCMPEWETEAILLGARDRAGWVELAGALADWLDAGRNAEVPLKDLAATLNSGQSPFPFRVGMVVESTADLRARLGALVGRLGDPACRSIRDAKGTYFWEGLPAEAKRVAFLFPGEGSQYPGMLADLCPHFPELRRVLDTSDRIALERGHKNLPSEELFGSTGEVASGLWEVETAVNVVLSSQWALYQVLTRLGLKPGAVVGHSSGEFLALAAAGVFPTDRELEDRLGDLGSVFGELEAAGKVPAASLVAVAADRSRVEAACREAGCGAVEVAMDNCPHQVVMAGEPAQVEAVAARLRAQGALLEPLPFGRAYHTARFADAVGPIREFFRVLPMRRPSVAIYSCATAAFMGHDVETIRRLAVHQWVAPVAFRSTIEAMYADGVRVFVEVGARGNLTGFVEDTLRGRPHFAVAANVARRSGLTQLNHLVASLYAQGVPIRPEYLYARRRPCRVDLASDYHPPRGGQPLAPDFPEMKLSDALIERLRNVERPTPPAERGRPALMFAIEEPHPSNGKASANGHVGVAARVAETFQTVLDRVTPHPVNRVPAPASPAPDGDPEEELLAYFETMDRFLETQRQVMAAYLGSRPASAGPPPPVAAAPAFEPIAVEPPIEVAPDTEAKEILLEQVSSRTGYPREMLDLDYDMEGDLGIDSIKRVEILGELHDRGVVPVGTDMESLSRCRTLGQVLAALEGAGSKSRECPDGAPVWVGETLRHVPGREFLAIRTLVVRDDPVASQHTLGGRRISAVEPARLGLPVVPFTVMTEVLAQAAAMLVPAGQTVVALRDVQANRWIAYDEGQPVALEVMAERGPARPDEVRVSIRNRGTIDGPRTTGDDPTVVGVVVFGDRREPGPAPSPFALDDAGPCRFTAEELYDDQWLFHGPMLQALTGVGASSRRGISGALRVLPHRDLLPTRLWPKLHTDPIVLDAFTHLLGCWGLDKKAGEEGDVIFPLRVASLSIFGADPPEGSSIECRIRVVEVSRHLVKVDADLVGPDGRIWVAIVGWEDWRFYWPGRYRDVLRQPDSVFVGEPLDVTPSGPGVAAVWLEPPADMTKPVWKDVLEWVQLSPTERPAGHALGRIAAKEAARRLWQAQGLTPVYPADLEIQGVSEGHPRLISLAEPGRTGLPAVAMSQTAGVALAIAALDSGASVGIAVLAIDERGEWEARVRCARDAAGLGPQGEVVGVNRASGEVRVWPVGGETIRCHTARRGEYAWAWTIFERTDP